MSGTGQSMTGQRALAARDRMREAVEMRRAGKGFVEIAETLGYKDASGAYRAVRRAMDMAVREPAGELIELEVDRLDALLGAHYDRALGGDPRSTELVLRLMERRARLLGLDAPEKYQNTDNMTRVIEIVGVDVSKL